ncbi:type II toxin-antitoxin system VapC family toxin [Microbacterium sp. NPDC077644]|uniref:type II toxin-antitoxin system VapC family toxin n=1 Tax=Microbacterium sp. NPDC077644 TaxID=3155055 RepID=UPI00344E75D8
MIVLDTNVVSEFMRPSPDATVLAWLDGIPRGEVWTTSVTVAEIAAGIAGLPEGKQRTRLQSGFITALRGFDDRILAFTAVAALKYGEIIGHRNRLGRPISIADAQIASIAEHAQATLATRNTRDFDGIDVTVINPWDADAARP